LNCSVTMSKRIRIFTAEDVAEHTQRGNVWVSAKGKVYDVSSFASDHPGGDDILLKYAGQDVTAVMKDASEHEHSESAYSILDDLLIGKIGTEETGLLDKDWEATDDFKPEDTDEAADFAKNSFLDLRKPLIRQVWEANWSKSYYLKQVHQPRHIPEPARLFGPSYLEVFTRTSWYVVPLIWVPISAYLFLRSLLQFTGPLAPFTVQPLLSIEALMNVSFDTFMKTSGLWALGVFIWTLLEYTLHRFLFHVDDRLPDTPTFIMLHFLLHGIHHYLPMDPMRLVMPPLLFTVLQAPFTHLAHQIFPAAVANGIISGAFAMYVAYDLIHYALHHSRLPKYLREQKKYHLAHHYKDMELGFGITSKFWDIVFNTILPI